MNKPGIRQCVQHMMLMAVLAPSALMAQSAPRLSLFEGVESSSSATATLDATVVNGSTSNSVQFVLVGTSQIGDKHRARLRGADGQTITVDLDPRGITPIPGFPGYEISRVDARELEVRHPASMPCVPSREQGVTCAGTHQARLQLATAAAVVRPATPVDGQPVDAEQNAAATAEGAAPENPFAAALRAARERGDAADPATVRAEGARFRPRRIDPADVPPGAQLIRTPFGDRIVVQ